MMSRQGISTGNLVVIVLSLVLSIGVILVFSNLIEFNLNEDISKSLSYTFTISDIGVSGTSNAQINAGIDTFQISAVLDEGGVPISYENIEFILIYQGGESVFKYGDTLDESTYTTKSLLKSQDDIILRSLDKVKFTLISPYDFEGGETFVIEIKEVGSDKPLRTFVELPNNLYGKYMDLR